MRSPQFRIATGCSIEAGRLEMAGVEIGDFGSPDETRTPDKDDG